MKHIFTKLLTTFLLQSQLCQSRDHPEGKRWMTTEELYSQTHFNHPYSSEELSFLFGRADGAGRALRVACMAFSMSLAPLSPSPSKANASKIFKTRLL